MTSINKTGGGPSDQYVFDDLQNRVIELLDLNSAKVQGTSFGHETTAAEKAISAFQQMLNEENYRYEVVNEDDVSNTNVGSEDNQNDPTNDVTYNTIYRT